MCIVICIIYVLLCLRSLSSTHPRVVGYGDNTNRLIQPSLCPVLHHAVRVISVGARPVDLWKECRWLSEAYRSILHFGSRLLFLLLAINQLCVARWRLSPHSAVHFLLHTAYGRMFSNLDSFYNEWGRQSFYHILYSESWRLRVMLDYASDYPQTSHRCTDVKSSPTPGNVRSLLVGDE